MGTQSSASYRTLQWSLLAIFLVMLEVLTNGTPENSPVTSEFLQQVSGKILEESAEPFCFTRDLNDLICFWENIETDNASFYYTIQDNDEEVQCPLRLEATSNDTWWHICEFPAADVLLFTPIEISVTLCKTCNTTRRQIYVNDVVLLDPPLNVTVNEKQRPWGLLISWRPPYHYIKAEDMKYQVNYSSTKDEEQTSLQVEVEAGLDLFLTELTQAQYTICVRAKADGSSYRSYWSDWTTPVTVETSKGNLDYIGYVVCAIIVALFAGGGVYLITKHGWHLKHKVWPQVPTPESHFQGLFTTHTGNFKLWLGQADQYLLWISRHVFHEDPSCALEVLSELPSATLPHCINQHPSKDSYVVLDENRVPCAPQWLEVQRVNNNTGRSQNMDARLLETGVRVMEGNLERQMTLTEHNMMEVLEEQNRHNGIQRVGIEEVPIKAPTWQRISREDSLSSEEKQSIPSSFEYTVLETCEGLLSPKPRPIPTRVPLKYAYLVMSDSEEQSPPPSPNLYQNSLIAHLPPPIYSHC